MPTRPDLRDAERRPRPRRASTQLGGAARPPCGASTARSYVSARAERERARGSATASSTQAIQMFTYYNNGEPLLVVDEEPRPHQHPGHTYVVKRGTRRQKPPRGATTATAPPETTYTLYSKSGGGHWRLVKGIDRTHATGNLNLNTLVACARNPKNEWGNLEQGTLEQMNARAPRQLQELWDACGAVQKPLLSMDRANSIVNGASTCLFIFCPFPTQVRSASNTTVADDSQLAFCGLWAILLAKLKRKGSCGWLMDF